MLQIYTRHSAGCEHREDIYWRRCRCPKWLRGVLRNGEILRQAAGTRSWEQAERQARQKETESDPTRAEPAPCAIPLRDAVRLFVDDQRARGLGPETTRKYRGLLERAFLSWAERERLVMVNDLRAKELTKFRASWRNGGSTTFGKHEKMCSFFQFCVNQGYLKQNPMKLLKKPKMPELAPTDYFRPEEFAKVIAATYRYNFGGGNQCHLRGQQLRAHALLMRWSGLAILDSTTLERARLSRNEEGDDQIFLYRAKTNVPVYVVIPPDVADQLRALPSRNSRYFFWSGNGDPRSARKSFERSYWKLFKLARIEGEDGQTKRCHPHMFRDTFAVELLLAGNPIDQVSLLLGHSSVKITERHYAPFCKARQLQLTAAVKKAWTGRAGGPTAITRAGTPPSPSPAPGSHANPRLQ